MTETAWKSRMPMRPTLKPTVQDLCDQVINRSTPDEDGDYLYRSRGNFRFLNGSPSLLQPRPQFLQATPTQSAATCSSPRRPARQFSAPAQSATPRIPSSTEQVFYRHVQRSARLRSRQDNFRRTQSSDLVYPSNGLQSAAPLDPPFLLSASLNGDSRNVLVGNAIGGNVTPRSRSRPFRPATTGRYFNSSNGLRSSSRASVQRPATAAPWPAASFTVTSAKLYDKAEGFLAPSLRPQSVVIRSVSTGQTSSSESAAQEALLVPEVKPQPISVSIPDNPAMMDNGMNGSDVLLVNGNHVPEEPENTSS